jgi:hypothetical protein
MIWRMLLSANGLRFEFVLDAALRGVIPPALSAILL